MDVFEPIRRFDRFQQRHEPLALVCATLRKFNDDQAASFAVAVAFYAFFAIFPLLLVFMTVLGYVLSGDQSLMHSVSESVLGRFPVIGQSLQNDRLHGSALALIAGIALSLWSSLGVTGAITTALDHVWDDPAGRARQLPQEEAPWPSGPVRRRIAVRDRHRCVRDRQQWPGRRRGIEGLWRDLLPPGQRLRVPHRVHVAVLGTPPWRKLLPGAVAAGVVWTVLQLLGGLYIDHIKKSGSAYGTFALVLGILAWLHLGSQLTMFCAELNTVLEGKRWPRSLLGDQQVPVEEPVSA